MDGDRRYYTVAEANMQVAALRELFGRVMQLRAQLKTLYGKLDRAGYAPRDEDLVDEDEEEDEDDRDTAPSDPVPPEVARDQAWFRGLVETLREQLEDIQATGCVIKDVEIGLVDWLAIHEGREVFLCWKYGEAEVAWWHELEGGFAGRRPINELDPGATE